MLRSAEALRGYTLLATDGEIGRVDAFLFDVTTSAVRYLVVRTGMWLLGRLVLVAPALLGPMDHEARALAVALTSAHVEASPEVDAEEPGDMPAQGIGLARHYGQSMIWGGPGAWSPASYPESPGANAAVPADEQGAMPQEHVRPPRLRSTHLITGYRVRGRDAELGHAADFILDDLRWVIRYMVVDTGTWWSGPQVLVASAWIRHISWGGDVIAVDLDAERVRQGPRYNPLQPVTRADEEQLYRHYGQPGYWEESA